MIDIPWNLLDHASIITGLILAIPVFWTWYTVTLGARRKQRRQLREIRKQPGTRPGILVIDLIPGRQILANVENHCAAHPELKAIPADRQQILQREQNLYPDDMAQLTDQIRQAHAKLISAGVTTIHCFYAGPTTAAMLIGAEFANGAQLMLYQYDSGEYRNFGPLHSPRLDE